MSNPYPMPRSMMARLYPADNYTTNLLALTVGLQRAGFECISALEIIDTRIILKPDHPGYHYDIDRLGDEFIITGYRQTPSFWDDVRHAFGYGYTPLFKLWVNTETGWVHSEFLHKEMVPFELKVLVTTQSRRFKR